jgi:hypothetical protein
LHSNRASFLRALPPMLRIVCCVSQFAPPSTSVPPAPIMRQTCSRARKDWAWRSSRKVLRSRLLRNGKLFANRRNRIANPFDRVRQHDPVARARFTDRCSRRRKAKRKLVLSPAVYRFEFTPDQLRANGRRGGLAFAARHRPKQRSDHARRAVLARWRRVRERRQAQITQITAA